MRFGTQSNDLSSRRGGSIARNRTRFDVDSPPTGGVIGIDPGAQGGIAYVWRPGLALAWPLKKMTERDIWELIKRLSAIANHVVLEKVTRAGSAYATGVLLSSRSALKMAVIAAEEVPLYEVAASVWQRKMQCLTGGDKKVSKARAQELFPEGPKMTHAIADAILLAEFGRTHIYKGDPLA